MITDYCIESVENPAFATNIAIMIQNILKAGGTCPTITARVRDGAEIPGTDPIEYEQVKYLGDGPMVGTKAVNGRIQLHFRLRELLTETELILMLKEGMAAPMPPVAVTSIRSAFKEIWVYDGDDLEGNPTGHYEYNVVMQASKATFLKYMADVPDGLGGVRPPTVNDTLTLSGYAHTDNIELV